MNPYPSIADYAVIGCTRSAALISRGGSIDWLCWPRFDSQSIFARILDHRRGGFFAIRPAGEFRSTRRYIPRTNVLETTFECKSGKAKLIDLMPVMREEDKRRFLTPFRQILRRIEGVEGEVASITTLERRQRAPCAIGEIDERLADVDAVHLDAPFGQRTTPVVGSRYIDEARRTG